MAVAPKWLGIFTIFLGLASITMQILIMTVNSPDPGESYGAGIWCGAISVISGVAVMFKRDNKNVVLIAFAVGAIFGIVLLGIAAAYLATWVPLLQFCELTYHPDYCNTHVPFHAVLVAVGSLTIIVNLGMILMVVIRKD